MWYPKPKIVLAQRLFRFRKRSLPFLTIDATIANQAFGHVRCNIFPYNIIIILKLKGHITQRLTRECHLKNILLSGLKIICLFVRVENLQECSYGINKILLNKIIH